MSPEPVLVLLVEDNEDHAELLKRTLREAAGLIRIVHARDGEAALDYLGLSGPSAGREKNEVPGLVLLDLRLPRIDGLDVLRRIKEAQSLRPVPVVILTTSSAPADIARAYSFHANSYLAKPVSYDHFSRLMQTLSRYWTVWNARPGMRRAAPGLPA
jgi:two-component system response regulator